MTKIIKILLTIFILMSLGLVSLLVMKNSYDQNQKKIEEENKIKQESISNLNVIDVSKMKELFSSNDTKIIFIGSLNCSHCTSIKPIINEIVKKLNEDVYYLELSTMTKEENEKYENINQFFKENTSIPLVVAVKNNEVIDNFVGEQSGEYIESFLKRNLNIK